MENSGRPTVENSGSIEENPRASGCFRLGLTLNIFGLFLAAALLLQLEYLPFGKLLLGWWPVILSLLTLVSAWCLGAQGTSEASGCIFRIRCLALVQAGMAPFWQMLPLAVRVNALWLGVHVTICMLLALLSFLGGQFYTGRLVRLYWRDSDISTRRWLERDRILWGLFGGLPFVTLIACVILVLGTNGELKWRLFPKALLQSIVGVGAAPVMMGWLFFGVCLLSALCRMMILFGSRQVECPHVETLSEAKEYITENNHEN